jgi:sulfur carrier protein
MNVELNGHDVVVREGATVAELVEKTGAAPGARGLAVAIDGEVVPRSAWEETRVEEGQQVEVLEARQGG